MKITLSYIIVLLLLTASQISAQPLVPPFQKEIQEFKKQDSLHFPPKGAILLVGSSSFTKWTDVYDYFPGRVIINRGFGGSKLPDVIRYAKDIIFPYRAKQVVIYCGDNDLASSDTITPHHVLKRFQTLFELIRSHDKNVSVAFVSIKPSPSRIKLMDKMKQTNKLIRDYLTTKKKATYIDVFYPMLLANGRPDPSLFVEDSLHINARGYVIWQKQMRPYLK